MACMSFTTRSYSALFFVTKGAAACAASSALRDASTVSSLTPIGVSPWCGSFFTSSATYSPSRSPSGASPVQSVTAGLNRSGSINCGMVMPSVNACRFPSVIPMRGNSLGWHGPASV